jgi:hypothetical protein
MASPLGDMKSGMKNPIKKNTFGTVSAAPPEISAQSSTSALRKRRKALQFHARA